MNRGSDEVPIQALSFLTFAEGGFDRDALGMIGGIAGKGVVGVVLASVFKGGIGKFAGGLGSIFGKTQSKRSILFMLFGMLLGMVLYIIFAGEYASGATANDVEPLSGKPYGEGTVMTVDIINYSDNATYAKATLTYSFGAKEEYNVMPLGHSTYLLEGKNDFNSGLLMSVSENQKTLIVSGVGCTDVYTMQ